MRYTLPTISISDENRQQACNNQPLQHLFGQRTSTIKVTLNSVSTAAPTLMIKQIKKAIPEPKTEPCDDPLPAGIKQI
jgi:hypothetical protein